MCVREKENGGFSLVNASFYVHYTYRTEVKEDLNITILIAKWIYNFYTQTLPRLLQDTYDAKGRKSKR